MLLRRFLRVKIIQSAYSFEINKGTAGEAGTIWLQSVIKDDLVRCVHSTDELVRLLTCFVSYFFRYIGTYIDDEEKKYFPAESSLELLKTFYHSGGSQNLCNFTDSQKRNIFIFGNWDIRDIAAPVFHEVVLPGFFEKLPSGKGLQSSSFLASVIAAILAAPLLRHKIEEREIWWEDALTVAIPAVKRITAEISSSGNTSFTSIFKDLISDMDFCTGLIGHYFSDHDRLDNLLSETASNWDLKRIFLIDKIIIKLALCEIFHFPSIPPVAALNEYVEISKYFCTPESGKFINGIVDKIREKK